MDYVQLSPAQSDIPQFIENISGIEELNPLIESGKISVFPLNSNVSMQFGKIKAGELYNDLSTTPKLNLTPEDYLYKDDIKKMSSVLYSQNSNDVINLSMYANYFADTFMKTDQDVIEQKFENDMKRGKLMMRFAEDSETVLKKAYLPAFTYGYYGHYGFTSSVPSIFTIDPVFDGRYHDSAKQLIQEVAKEINEVAVTDLQRIYLAYDYVQKKTTYFEDFGEFYNFSHSYIGITHLEEAVCQGYAVLYKLLLDELGIESKYITGYVQGISHAWVKVKYNGKWYNSDTTWADQGTRGFNTVTNSTETILGHKRISTAKYFLLSDQKISTTHMEDSFATYPDANDTTFDGMMDLENNGIQDTTVIDSNVYILNNNYLYRFSLIDGALSDFSADFPELQKSDGQLIGDNVLYLDRISKGEITSFILVQQNIITGERQDILELHGENWRMVTSYENGVRIYNSTNPELVFDYYFNYADTEPNYVFYQVGIQNVDPYSPMKNLLAVAEDDNVSELLKLQYTDSDEKIQEYFTSGEYPEKQNDKIQSIKKNHEFTINFSEVVSNDVLDKITLINNMGYVIATTNTLLDDAHTVRVNPSMPLLEEQHYTLHVDVSTTSLSGSKLMESVIGSFVVE